MTYILPYLKIDNENDNCNLTGSERGCAIYILENDNMDYLNE